MTMKSLISMSAVLALSAQLLLSGCANRGTAIPASLHHTAHDQALNVVSDHAEQEILLRDDLPQAKPMSNGEQFFWKLLNGIVEKVMDSWAKNREIRKIHKKCITAAKNAGASYPDCAHSLRGSFQSASYLDSEIPVDVEN